MVPEFSFLWYFILKAQIKNELWECKVDLETKFHDDEKILSGYEYVHECVQLCWYQQLRNC